VTDSAPRSDTRRTPEEERDWLLAVLAVQSELQEMFIRNGADRAWWDAALRKVIGLTGSAFGFLGRIERDPDGTPFLHSLAITDIAWNEWSRQVFDDFAADGLEFRNLQSLFGVTVATGQVVVSDDPATDPRRCGLPPGHPPLHHYVGLPLRDGHEAIGMLGLANSPRGYRDTLEDDLQPVLSVLAAMIARDGAERRAREAAATARDLESAVAGLTRSGRDRETIDQAVRDVLAAASLADAEAIISSALANLLPGMQAQVFMEDAADPTRLAAVAEARDGLDRSQCEALRSGRAHVSLPGLRVGSCSHVDPMVAATICAPVATDDDEYGLVTAYIREFPQQDGSARVAEVAGELERLASALAQVALREALASRALRDPLTGLPNRDALQQDMERRLRRIEAAARPFGVLVLDLDDFKQVNDTLGHVAGDRVLEEAAAALAGSVRDDDLVGRIGGDEFAIILAAGDPEVMLAAANRLVTSMSGVSPAGGPATSASVGGVPVGWGDVTWEDAYARADELLYEAKRAGKGRAVIGDMLGVPEQP
jgi:diguanylate cyclase (GGDEF)-like protein